MVSLLLVVRVDFDARNDVRKSVRSPLVVTSMLALPHPIKQCSDFSTQKQ